MKRIPAARRRLARNFLRLSQSFYYRFFFGRQMLLSKQLERIVRFWEIRLEKSDIPKDEDAWKAQYLSKKWKYLAEINELARYSIIIGYMAHLRPGGAIFDVGCGEGILFERFRPYGYSKYLGIDISETSLTELIEKQDEKTLFIKADAETYTPSEHFDIIVFNETLYYLHDPFKVVERYSHILKKDGVLVVSTYKGTPRGMSILHRLKATYPLLDESRTLNMTSSKSWICSVFEPIRKDE